VHCVEETIPQATRDVHKNRGKQINQIAHRPTQQRINISDNNQFPPINPNQTPIQMPLAPQISYSQSLQQNK
jgi:2,4-dienoyl-CoA reductase-like NADH-dependent reductase (Old Yellow Enzyme family)